MNKPIHPAVAEHVIQENERLRDALRSIAGLPIDACITENDYRLSAAKSVALGAISRQAEPECRCTMRQRLVGDGCSVCNPEYAADHEAEPCEPAPAQDELRKRFSQIEDEIMAGKHTAASVFTQMRTAALYIRPAQDERELCPSCNGSGSSGGRMHCNAAGDSEYEAFRCENCDGFGTHLARPAQTEQQPVALPPFAAQVLEKLERVDECFSDGEGADIGREWFDVLTLLGLLKREKRSPALWSITRQGRDALDAPIAQTAPHAPCWRDMATAPRDGTLVQLLVEFDENATDDTDGPAPTIGANNFKNDGEDRWQFAGWCWSHDRFTEGHGTPVGWLPMAATIAQTAQRGEA